MLDFLKKETQPVQINLSQPMQIEGYIPNPAQCKAFVFKVDKNITDTVIGVGKGTGIRVPITTAEIDPKHPLAKIYGKSVILVDSKYVSGLWMPGRTKELLAALAATNARIWGDQARHWKVPESNNIANSEVGDVGTPERVFQILDGGTEYGFKAARNAANRQNKMIDKGLKPIVKDLNKQFKTQQKTGKVAVPKPPKANRSLVNEVAAVPEGSET